jgi:hypothetical protein
MLITSRIDGEKPDIISGITDIVETRNFASLQELSAMLMIIIRTVLERLY